MQPKPLQAQVLGQQAVQRAFAMRGVAYQGVGDVLAMPTNLVAPPLQGFEMQ
jgi:hypothetical protein